MIEKALHVRDFIVMELLKKNFWLRDRLFFVILVKNELLFD